MRILKKKVIVVGGGIIGTSTAYFLAKAGADVVLVEEKDIASGTTSACDQGVLLQTKKPGPVLELAQKSSVLYEAIANEFDYDFEYKKCGGMILMETELEHEMVKQHVEMQKSAGMQVQMLTRKEALEIQPGLADSVIAGTWCGDDAAVNSMRVAYAMTDAASKLGATFIIGKKVTKLIVEGDMIKGIEMNGEKLYADAVILTTGIWTPFLLKDLGLDIPIVPRRGQILVTEKIAPFLNPHIIHGAYIAAKGASKSSGSEASNPAGVGLVIGQTKSGNLLIGGSREFVGFNRETTTEVTDHIAREAIRVFPALANVRIVRTFAGLRPFTPDSAPIISPVEQLPGLFIGAGHEGDGIALAPITGKVLADLVLEHDLTIDLAPFSLNRFQKAEANVGLGK